MRIHKEILYSKLCNKAFLIFPISKSKPIEVWESRAITQAFFFLSLQFTFPAFHQMIHCLLWSRAQSASPIKIIASHDHLTITSENGFKATVQTKNATLDGARTFQIVSDWEEPPSINQGIITFDSESLFSIFHIILSPFTTISTNWEGIQKPQEISPLSLPPSHWEFLKP